MVSAGFLLTNVVFYSLDLMHCNFQTDNFKQPANKPIFNIAMTHNPQDVLKHDYQYFVREHNYVQAGDIKLVHCPTELKHRGCSCLVQDMDLASLAT